MPSVLHTAPHYGYRALWLTKSTMLSYSTQLTMTSEHSLRDRTIASFQDNTKRINAECIAFHSFSHVRARNNRFVRHITRCCWTPDGVLSS